MFRRRIHWIGWLLLCQAVPGTAAVRCAGIFGDRMVLQQGLPVPVWGRATPGESVAVQFQGQVERAVATDGRWMVVLDPLRAGGPDNLVVSGEQNTLIFRDVLVGEVWLCSGQSNMAYRLELSQGGREAAATAAQLPLRFLSVPKEPTQMPRADRRLTWQIADASTAAQFSAVGYYFGAALAAARKVPIGLIDASVGGTPIEAWMSREAIESAGDSATLLRYQRAMASWDQAVQQARAAQTAWEQAAAAATAAGRPAPAPPFDRTRTMPSVLYNGLIAPVAPYAVRGVVWYQGESDADRPAAYRQLLSGLVNDWRQRFDRPELPFVLIQLPGYQATGGQVDSWALVREAQLQVSQTVPHTALVVTCDLGESDNLHPRVKQPVGERAARAARQVAYGEPVPGQGPTLLDVTRESDRLRLRFRTGGGTLRTSSGLPTGFSVAGSDGYFYPAEAAIQGASVLVYSAAVSAPVSVRYGWGNVPRGNLTDSYGNPVSPFRTDGQVAATLYAER